MKKVGKKTFFIIAGEQSGDLHGSKLIRSIKKLYPNSHFIGHGGELMKKEGLKLIYHTNDLAVMGLTEVVKKLPFLLNVMGETLGKIREVKPDRIILIDYPGFNLRLSRNISGLNIPITYFILPQLWAWKENRKKYFLNYIDQAISIFPFEKEWFERNKIPTGYYGHPFSDINISIDEKLSFLKRHNLSDKDEYLILLPGSRQHEIDKHWPIFLKTVKKLKEIAPDLKILVGQSPGITIPETEDFLVEAKNIQVAISCSKLALASSGTVTLECAVLDTPVVVCYKLSYISNFILNIFNKSKYISIVNILLGKKAVPELIQSNMNVTSIVKELSPLLHKSEMRKKMLNGFSEIRKLLGYPGSYDRIANKILQKT